MIYRSLNFTDKVAIEVTGFCLKNDTNVNKDIMPIKANSESSLLNLLSLPNLITKKPTAKVKPLLRAFDIVIVCPSVRLGLTILKFSYWLVWHRNRPYPCLNMLMLDFCLGSSHPSLKVCEVKCVPGDPAITCPVLFKGSRSPLLLA